MKTENFFKNWKLRASQAGLLMNKGPDIGQTGKSLLYKIFIREIYDKRKIITSDPMRKGIDCEEQSVELLSKYYNRHFVKNTERFDNDFFTGEPDIYDPFPTEIGIDIKNSFDCYTFPLLENDLFKLAPVYWWQSQVYMELLGMDKYHVIYTLNDAPDWLVTKTAWMLLRESGENQMTDDFIEETRQELSYSNYPLEKRIKIFEVERSAKSIMDLQCRVDQAREILKDFNNKFYKITEEINYEINFQDL